MYAAQRFTLEQCKAKMKADNNSILLKFCPILKHSCRGEVCICFRKAVLLSAPKNDGIDMFYYYPPTCKNPLVSGVIIVEEDS